MPGVPLLEITGLRTEIRLKRSVVRAVDGVDLAVGAGETLGLVGESGCGKTMTANSILRLLPNGGRITAGRILFDGRDLTQASDSEMARIRGNDIGMVFQDPGSSLNPTMTVGEQVAETVLLHRGASAREAMAEAVETLALVGMPSPRQRARDYPHQLSGGMRQRAMIAMALVCRPRLLIADEPTTALDVTVQKQVLELIDDLKQQLGMAVILVTHDLGVIAGHADRIVVMYAGKAVETADTRTLFEGSRHPYTEALFDALPERAAEAGGRLYSIPGLPPDLTRPPAGCRFAARCRYAHDRCRDEEPQLGGESAGHTYACFFPTGGRDGLRLTGVAERGESAPQPDTRESDGRSREPLLVVTDLVKEFPITRGAVLRRTVGAVSAVAGVSLEVRHGETFGLVGESGCGKTTIGRLLVGLERATSGEIVFGGRTLTGRPGRRRERAQVQLMFQDSYASLDPRMRVGSILGEPLAVQRIGSRAQRRERVRELADGVGLPAGALDRYPHEFSGGQRQRIGFARALALGPKMIVADEPVSALDVSIQAQMLNLMNDLRRDLGLTYVFVSHDLSVVRYLSDRIGVMYLGKLVEVGPAGSVCSNPVHPYTRGLLDAVALADPEAELAKGRRGVTGEPPSAIDPPSGCRFRTRCPAAQEICAAAEPKLSFFGPDDHRAACHFPVRGPVA